MTALATLIDDLLDEVETDLRHYEYLLDPVRIPAEFIEELGHLLSAGVVSSDTDLQKRQKVATAVAAHKRRCSFNLDAKPKIDIICGGNSSVVHSYSGGDWIEASDDSFPTAYYWATIAGDDSDSELGLILVGSGFEIVVAGNVYIDVDNAALSADDQARLEFAMQDIVPAYMYVHFGYFDITGAFVEYFVMGT